MGYGSGALRHVEDILASLEKSAQMHVLELGAQEINYDVLPSTIFHFIYRLNPDFPNADEIARLLPGCFAAPVFRAANIRYACIDLFEAEDVVHLDLNVSALPSEHRAKYDLVTNMGTTEHIFNQARAFEAVHDATKVGGIMLHAVPCNGYFNHGLFKYEPKFFLYLAHANKYEIVDWSIVEGVRPDYMPLNDDIPGSKNWIGRDLSQSLVRFVLRKRTATPFVQPSDVDLRYVPRDYPASILNAAVPSTSSMPALEADSGSKPNPAGVLPAATMPVERPLPKLVQVLTLIESRCAEAGLGPEPYALAASILSADLDPYITALEFRSPTAARQALDAMVSKAAGRTAASRDGQCSIDLGLAFLGTGWGKAGGDVYRGQARHFRALGPDGQSRLFVHLAPGRDYRVNILLFDAVPGDAARRMRVIPASDGKIDVVADDYWHRSKLAKEEVSRRSGQVELRFGVSDADKMILQKIIFEPVI
jgi:SAM-dependent methyltransferase